MKIYRISLLCSVFLLSLAGNLQGKVVYLSSLVSRQGSAETVFRSTVKEGNTVVDFYADWCGPCKRLTPILNTLAQQFPDVTFLKVNTEQFGSIASNHSVRGIPALVFYRNGKEVSRQVGLKSQSELARIIKQVFK